MKKLLLILICLFVSFEVRSKEIILSCKVEYQNVRNFVDINKKKESSWEKTILGFNLYLDLKNKWLDLHKKDYYENITNSNFEENNVYITHEFRDESKQFSQRIKIKLQRFNGIFSYENTQFNGPYLKGEYWGHDFYKGVCENTSKMKRLF